MAVICVTIIQSAAQVVAGIPKTVSICTNIPTTIFYTLDGSTPTLNSTMYVGPIFLPYDQLLVTLSVLATNGVDTSPVVVECYGTDIVHGNARLPHSATTARPGSIIPDAYPFGNPPFEPDQKFINPADSGITVFNPARPAKPTAFDGAGNPTSFTNEPYNTENYQITYTNRDAEGQQNSLLGNIPATVTLPEGSIGDTQPDPGQTSQQGPEASNQFTAMFDPRALVIFQDFSLEDPNNPPQINRAFFSLENSERVRDGTFYFNTGVDATPPPSGSFVRAHFNPRTQSLTHYYRDSWSNRWIISTSPYQPNPSFDNSLAASVIGRNSHVYEWVNFKSQKIF